MIGRLSVLELRMRRAWRIAILIAVPAFAVLMVVGSAAILRERGAGIGELVLILFIVATLGGLIVVPGTAVLLRHARGAPDVRIDERGVVWGNDRTRDLSIDWRDVDRVTIKTVKAQYTTDRALILRPVPGSSGSPARTVYGRVLSTTNRFGYGGRFAISTMVEDHGWEEVRDALAAHLPGRPIEEV